MSPRAAPAEPLTAAGVVEGGVRRLLAEPALFLYGALGIGLAFAVVQHRHVLRSELEVVGLTAVTAVWLRFWIGQWHSDATGRRPPTIALALMGGLLQGGLLTLHFAFAIFSLSLLAQYFALLPFGVAVLCGIPPALGSEYSHRAAVLIEPAGYPWMVAILRTLALIAVGVSFKVLALQMEERKRLETRLLKEQRRAGRLEERQRLAREIHDTLAQGFAGIVVHLERAEQIDSLVSSPAKPLIELARSVAREGMEDARRMLAALRPEVLEQHALPEALGRICEEWSRRSNVAATMSVTGNAAPTHPEIDLTVLRAVQESLTNVARHAEARSVAVTLSYMGDVLAVDIQDDGKGFVPGTPGGGGFGLAGMRERTARLQGSLSVESIPGEGTTVSLTLPLVFPSGGETLSNAGLL
ncbi:MAG TPA: sensor histidine kinase [Gemmatimonadales bacterium]|nr:sensor histidine kinase [Gemmatimonadales bacterium]